MASGTSPLGHRLIATAVELYQGEDIGLGLKEPLYAMDYITIDLCLTLFPWADCRQPPHEVYSRPSELHAAPCFTGGLPHRCRSTFTQQGIQEIKINVSLIDLSTDA